MVIGYEAKRIFHNRSGLGNYGRNLIRALATHYPEHHYRLYNPGKGTVPFGAELEAITEVKAPFTNKLFANVWRQKLVSAQAARENVQIFHGISHELPADLRKNGLRSVVTIHDLIFLRYPNLYKWTDRKIYLKKVKLAVKRADTVVAISRQTKQDLVELLQVPQEKIEVIYQGCAPVFKKKQSVAEIEQLKEHYTLPSEYLLFVGTLEERKNVKLILEAIRKLRIQAVFIGKKTRYWKKILQQKEYADIQSIVSTPEVRDNTHLAGIYQGARLFVYPSMFEGFGIPVLEALESKTPVITSNRSSLPEAAGQDACLVNVDNAHALTQAIADIWHDESRRAIMAEKGYTHAQQFSDERLANTWVQLYERLLV